MNKFVTENLLLLEFLVDDISFTEITKKKIKCLQGVTNVEFRFLNNKPIVISAEEMQVACVNGKPTRSGKSCLFSLSTEQGIEALGNFLISLKVYQTLPPCVQPNTIDIADGEICISELFQDLMESAMKSSQKAWVKCQKEMVKLYKYGEAVGLLSCYVRMSCYGKYIVTQCEMSVGDFQEKQSPEAEVKQKEHGGSGEAYNTPCQPKCPEPVLNQNTMQQGDCACSPPEPPQKLKSSIASPQKPQNIEETKRVSYQSQQSPCGCIKPPTTPIEMTPKPYKAHRISLFKKPSKDKLILRLSMPDYAPDQCDPTKPYEFEFVTPAGWPRESLGRQCRDANCDCRDYPKGYLIEYYGAEKLAMMLYYQMQEEARREAIYGICPVGQFAPDPQARDEGKKDKRTYAEMYYECLGVTDLMKNFDPNKVGGDGAGGGGGRGGGRGGKGGRDGKGGNRRSSQMSRGSKTDKNKNKFRRKTRGTCGIFVPDKVFPPPCPPCWCPPCIPLDPSCSPCVPCPPCRPCVPSYAPSARTETSICRPCSSGGPCKPCVPCKPCPPCRPCKPCLPCKPCHPCNPCLPCKPVSRCSSSRTCPRPSCTFGGVTYC